jgi:acetyl-CoA synthetase
MSSQIESLLNEDRRFHLPRTSPRTRSRPRASSSKPRSDREDLGRRARELHWHTPFTEVLDWTNPPFATWFADGELNVAYNCLDPSRGAGNGRARWPSYGEGEQGDERRVTLRESHDEGQALANCPRGASAIGCG